MTAPFPWFGGKSRVAGVTWDRFGDVDNYVEPFFGSGAVLLGRPHEPRVETVNDADCYLANFWRALTADPEAVAQWADWPVNEADLEARHLWLVNRVEFRERMKADPDYHDAKIAGWWVWGIGQWIGGGWCSGDPAHQRPHLGDAGMGVHRKLPQLGDAGRGVHVNRSADLRAYFAALAARLRRVRVCCGDWSRILGPSPTVKLGTTGVFLDPPYSAEAGRDMNIYREDSGDVAHAVREWALANGDNPELRIALCGYAGEHAMLPEWECFAWKAHGGYAQLGDGQGKENARRERIWFSPHCLSEPLFRGLRQERGLPGVTL